MLKVAPSEEFVLVQLSFDLISPIVDEYSDPDGRLRFDFESKDYCVEVKVPANYADNHELLWSWVQDKFADYDCSSIHNLNIWDSDKSKFRFA